MINTIEKNNVPQEILLDIFEDVKNGVSNIKNHISFKKDEFLLTLSKNYFKNMYLTKYKDISDLSIEDKLKIDFIKEYALFRDVEDVYEQLYLLLKGVKNEKISSVFKLAEETLDYLYKINSRQHIVENDVILHNLKAS